MHWKLEIYSILKDAHYVHYSFYDMFAIITKLIIFKEHHVESVGHYKYI